VNGTAVFVYKNITIIHNFM